VLDLEEHVKESDPLSRAEVVGVEFAVPLVYDAPGELVQDL